MDGIGSLINPNRAKISDDALLKMAHAPIPEEESEDASFVDEDDDDPEDDEPAASEMSSEVTVRKPAARRSAAPKSRESSIATQKAQLLFKLDRLEKSGEHVTRRFTLNDDIFELQTEVSRLERERSLRKSIKFQQAMLTSFTTGVEFMNNRFDPFGIHLEGWSENVHEGIDQYDDVFAELHDKYQMQSQMPPEFKLVMMLAGSAFMFHMTNTMFKSVPGMAHVMKQNPGLARDVAAATARTMAQDMPNDASNPMGAGLGGLAGMFSGLMSAGGNKSAQPARRPPATEVEEIFSEISDGDSVVREVQDARQKMSSDAPGASTIVFEDL